MGSIPSKSISNKKCTQRVHFSNSQPEGLAVEQATGIEPACLAWEASALPLSYACRAVNPLCGFTAQIREANLVYFHIIAHRNANCNTFPAETSRQIYATNQPRKYLRGYRSFWGFPRTFLQKGPWAAGGIKTYKYRRTWRIRRCLRGSG